MKIIAFILLFVIMLPAIAFTGNKPKYQAKSVNYSNIGSKYSNKGISKCKTQSKRHNNIKKKSTSNTYTNKVRNNKKAVELCFS